jgi:hypothetical protein
MVALCTQTLCNSILRLYPNPNRAIVSHPDFDKGLSKVFGSKAAL